MVLCIPSPFFPNTAVTLAILLYLYDKEVLDKFGRLNKTCYRLSRDNSLWRTRLQMKFPEIAYADRVVLCLILLTHLCSASGAQDLSVNWLARYKNEVESVRNHVW